MLQKQGQLKIKTDSKGLIVAKPDLKTAIGNGITRKYAVAKKGVRYRKIYKTDQARYMYFLDDLVDFSNAENRRKRIDVSDALLSGTITGLAGGPGTGYLVGEYLGRNKPPSVKTKYGVIGGIAGTLGLGTLGAYHNIRNQKKTISTNNSSSMVVGFAAPENKKKIKRVKPYERNGRLVSGYIVDVDTGKKRYLSPAEMHYEKNQRAKEELEYKMRRLEQAKAREERLQREDKRRPVDDVRKNISTAVNVSREAKGWLNTGNKLLGWFG